MLTFDADKHEYRYSGRPVPHVTGVLADLSDWSRIPPDTLYRAQQEGVAIHKMVELDVAGEIDPGDMESLPIWLRPRYTAWRRFLNDRDFRAVGSERRVYHDRYRYAGTLDLVGYMGSSEWTFIDVKRSLYGGRVTGLQLAAYEEAYRHVLKAPKSQPSTRYALQLKDDGGYRLVPFTNKNDFTVFLACLTRHHFMESA